MKILAQNKKARFDYEILEEIEAGMALTGQEVKSIRLGRMGLKGSYVFLKRREKGFPEVFLLGAGIPPYQPKNAPAGYEAERPRKLLLKKAEIKRLIGKAKEKGLTLVPLKVYTKRGRIKIRIGIARGRKKADKREKIKKRDANREIRRALKGKQGMT